MPLAVLLTACIGVDKCEYPDSTQFTCGENNGLVFRFYVPTSASSSADDDITHVIISTMIAFFWFIDHLLVCWGFS